MLPPSPVRNPSQSPNDRFVVVVVDSNLGTVVPVASVNFFNDGLIVFLRRFVANVVAVRFVKVLAGARVVVVASVKVLRGLEHMDH